MQDNDARLKVVAEKLRTSIKQLCDKLKDNPNVAENMAKIASERQQLQVCYQQASAYFRFHLQLPTFIVLANEGSIWSKHIALEHTACAASLRGSALA